ncbi:Tfx family DNA-binding protein [Methanothermococcus okinawensis]|uniref:DNA binding protein, Tfx family n=1 Tax=Methanothermococcus okinawensis (strain DSM 14208 / JCM 11175 / IH1) TaxID=647113 RepID=F8ANC9_METOI|nr:Tfx family DNA-binding protein [Methanothermococcus okinawensis]AEH06188.1 DNA binding protein, Tfx family [Methanothermococcus okinawensis IH1]
MDSFLTDTQIKVLKLRKKGLTQEEIAKMMNTSRANISMIEKRAKENVEKARNTLRIYNDIISPVKLTIKEGVDVFDIPKMVFKTSDENDIHVKYSSLEILDLIHKNVKDNINKRIVKKPFIINILEDGELSFIE